MEQDKDMDFEVEVTLHLTKTINIRTNFFDCPYEDDEGCELNIDPEVVEEEIKDIIYDHKLKDWDLDYEWGQL